MAEVVSVRFKNKGKVYFFDPNGINVRQGENVIVDTAKGLEYAECAAGNHEVPDDAVHAPLRPVVRVATAEDNRRAEENRAAERNAYRVGREKIRAHKLDMKLVDVEYNFEGSKILFFFTSDGRVDFRDLVKDLKKMYHLTDDKVVTHSQVAYGAPNKWQKKKRYLRKAVLLCAVS